MREKKPFGRRTRGTMRQFKRKFLLVCEGLVSEAQYFEAIERHRVALKIDALIDIQIVERLFSEEPHSHPKALLRDLTKTLEDDMAGTRSVSDIVDRVISIQKERLLPERGNSRDFKSRCATFKNAMQEHCLTQNIDYQKSLRQEVLVAHIPYIATMATQFFESTFPQERLLALIEEKSIVYDSETDIIVLIVDRDAHSWKKDHYEAFLADCHRFGYALIVTNPCIEFWFLLHLKSGQDLDKERLLANKKLTGAKNAVSYVEDALRRALKDLGQPSYDKTNIPAEFLVSRVDQALKNVIAWCTDVTELESRIGSNLGTLIQAMRHPEGVALRELLPRLLQKGPNS